MTLKEYIDQVDFLALYKRKILPKKGGGRDNMSPETYFKSFEKEIEWLKMKLCDGSYRFSPYKEKLILKGKNKLPRVLSLPSVRDRFVLAILNEYLSIQLGISYMIPNMYISHIMDFIDKGLLNKKDIFFFKTDISAFFDNINHSVLLNSLSHKIDGTALKLVTSAITSPTISNNAERIKINTKGVPQGLAISNILAAFYVYGFHLEMERLLSNSLFLRYVDDIIILSLSQMDFKGYITESIEKHCLGLELTESKTAEGKIDEGFDYLGYLIKGSTVSVKKKNKDCFSNRLVKKCNLLSKQFEDPLIRPRFASSDKDFLDYAETDLNLMISGFKAGNHNYGWIAYFQRINDLTLLHQFDRLTKKQLGKEICARINLNSFVDTYFDLSKNGGRNILVNFDSIVERGRRIAYLSRLGYIRKSDSKDISDEEVDRLFNRMISNLQKISHRDVAEIS